MTMAMRVHAPGGADVMQWEAVTVPAPGPGQVRLRHTAVGVNFIDVYLRSGLYKAELPLVPGQEAAGVVEAVGDGVSGLRPGDRVAYAGVTGAYCEARVIAADRLVALPEGVPDRDAAALMLKGLTAQYLLRRIGKVGAGDWILVHAAAGGVGLIMCRWARALGARVIGTVGSDAKARIAAEHGCEFPVVYTREDFVARVRELTGGVGVNVAYDSVGKDTLMRTFDCVRRLGMLVSFGQSSGPAPPLEVGLLSQKGSLFLTRPTLGHYTATRGELEAMAGDLFAALAAGDVRATIGQELPLSEAVAAHRALEARATIGATVLVP